jgi:hypothetical protein
MKLEKEKRTVKTYKAYDSIYQKAKKNAPKYFGKPLTNMIEDLVTEIANQPKQTK